MASRQMSVMFEQRIREIVGPMLDEAVQRALATFLGGEAAGVQSPRVRPGGRAARGPRATPGRLCNVSGCGRPMRSKGYCAAHYQAARKYGWPMPSPVDFQAPVRRRGRPPKSAPAVPATPAKQARRKGRGRRRRGRARSR